MNNDRLIFALDFLDSKYYNEQCEVCGFYWYDDVTTCEVCGSHKHTADYSNFVDEEWQGAKEAFNAHIVNQLGAGPYNLEAKSVCKAFAADFNTGTCRLTAVDDVLTTLHVFSNREVRLCLDNDDNVYVTLFNGVIPEDFKVYITTENKKIKGKHMFDNLNIGNIIDYMERQTPEIYHTMRTAQEFTDHMAERVINMGLSDKIRQLESKHVLLSLYSKTKQGELK